jgi:hypothetical protein
VLSQARAVCEQRSRVHIRRHKDTTVASPGLDKSLDCDRHPFAAQAVANDVDLKENRKGEKSASV